MERNNKGSLTVEACLSLTIFLMVFLTILFLMRIVFAYGMIQHALNQTAKEFSGYSYYYAISGLGDINGKIQESTAGGIQKFNTDISNVVNVYDKFSGMGNVAQETVNHASNGDISRAISTAQSAGESYDAFRDSLGPAADSIRSVVEDPVQAIKAVGSVLANGANEAAKTYICGEMSRGMMAKYIAENYAAADQRLNQLRVVGGMSGLDFSASQFWSSPERNDIELVVCYTIDPVFPIKVIEEVNLVNRIKIRGWSGKSAF